MASEYRILIVDDVHPILMQILDDHHVSYQYEPGWDREQTLKICSEFNGLVLRSKFRIDSAFLENWPSLKVIGRAGAGVDNIDLAVTKLSGIQVFHAAEGNADAVGEHTVGLMLMLLNKLAMADLSVRKGEWNREAFRGMELKGKTVGLVGYGNMGRAVAKRLQGFDCEVIAYDKYLVDFPDANARKVDLETLLERTQILSLHIPLTDETFGWIDGGFLKSFQNLNFLINTSRGPILSIGGLCEVLESGQILGAALDVLPHEPPLKSDEKISEKYKALFRRSDVILSPHVAGWSLESYEKISRVLGDKLISLIA